MASHAAADSNMSMDADELQNIVGTMLEEEMASIVDMDDDDIEDAFDPATIPPKDSDDNLLRGLGNKATDKLAALADDVAEEEEESYEQSDEAEEKLATNIDDNGKKKEIDDKDVTQPETQQMLDETVMMLLQPEFCHELDIDERKKSFFKSNESQKYDDWNTKQFDNEVILVADAMSVIESIKMYDQEWYMDKEIDKEREDDKEKAKYLLNKVPVTQLNMVPDFGTSVVYGDDDDGHIKSMTTQGLDYLTTAGSDVLGAGTKVLGAGTKLLPFAGDKYKKGIACGACGVALKFKKKKHSSYYIGYKCSETGNEWVFHDYLCVKLRKIKEAIKDYVFECEKEENKNVEDENALIKIETSSSQKVKYSLRPLKKTTPRKGDHNYKSDYDFKELEDSSQTSQRNISSDLTEEDSDTESHQAKQRKFTQMEEEKEEILKAKNIEKLGYIIADDVFVPKFIDFRRFRTNIKRILDRVNAEKKYKGRTYHERFGDLPPILMYCDLNEFGVALFEFVSESMKSKMRAALWHILEWLALEMPTNEILHLLKKHTHLLSKHELVNYDRVCKATMEGSKFPIACTLRLSAFMYERAEVDLSNRDAFKLKGEQYVNVSRKLLKEIESDHLFALLLMLPTDIGHQNVIEIALKYDLTYFLEEPRIVRVFSVIWFHGFDFLDPEKAFNEPDIAADTVFDKLWSEPGRFFFSAFGKFVISSILYIGYLALFSFVTSKQIYDYPPLSEITTSEVSLWIASCGYVVFEVLEFTDSPQDYFSSMANYWDILIAINWLFLAYLRFGHKKHYQYDADGVLDEVAQRNTKATEMFMAAWSFQCIILWTRVASLFKISERAGPLIRMITNMLSDIFNFFLIWMLFFIGGSFAAYYIIGGDLQEAENVSLGTFSSVAFYIFKTLIGQQSWDRTASYANPEDPSFYIFDSTRSNMLQTLLLFYSVFGMILLLNLLIAMMASSYEAVKHKSLEEVNKQKIDTTYDLDSGRNIITPPFNVLAYFIFFYWYALEIVVFALTFGHRQFNEEYFSPINHELHQYSVGDIIKFTKGEDELKGKCVHKVSKALRKMHDPKRAQLEMRTNSVHAREANDNLKLEHIYDPPHGDLVVECSDGTFKPVYDSAITSVKKTLFKRRTKRIPSLAVENIYCRYCRYNISNDTITISDYLGMFDAKGQHIDPDDKKYMKALISTTDKYGIPTPLTCKLCPNCYRPFKVSRQGPDVLNRMMFTLEIVSYGVFWMTLRWVILLTICIPALLLKIIKFVIKTFTRTIAGKGADKKSKSIMNTSEENDEYRAKVRQVSKQEEKIDAVVRRIDGSVTRLEGKLLGDLNAFDDEFDDEEDAHNLRSDEFDQEMDKMKKALEKKFNRIQELLTNGNYFSQ